MNCKPVQSEKLCIQQLGLHGNQKINTRSSAESELISTCDVFPQILWTKHFLEKQHYNIDEHRIMRDNQSAMSLESNVKASSSKRTKHINVRYFFLKDYL